MNTRWTTTIALSLSLLVCAWPTTVWSQADFTINAPQLPRSISLRAVEGDKISLFGNRLGRSSMHGLGVETFAMYFKSNGDYRWYSRSNADHGRSALMTLTGNGNLGIGTSTPSQAVVVQADNPVLQIRDDGTNNSPDAARLELLERANGSFSAGGYLHWNGRTNRLALGAIARGEETELMTLDRGSGNVGIGTVDPSAKLAVNGDIRAREVVVTADGWADDVFDPDYRLPSLTDIEEHISSFGHLSGVPTQQMVEEHGVSIGKMQEILLRKVEELTLHLIRVNHEKEAMEDRLRALEGLS